MLQIERLHEGHQEDGSMAHIERVQNETLKTLARPQRSRRISSTSDEDGFDYNDIRTARQLSKDERRKLVRKAMSEVYRMHIRDPTSISRTKPTSVDLYKSQANKHHPSAQPKFISPQSHANQNEATHSLDGDSYIRRANELQERGNVCGLSLKDVLCWYVDLPDASIPGSRSVCATDDGSSDKSARCSVASQFEAFTFCQATM